MNTPARPTEDEIRAIVEIAVDNDIPNFKMDGNWYEDYEMDSLGSIALVVEVQKRFKVRVPDERMPDIRTGNQLVDVIMELRALGSVPAEADAEAH